jgi:hypothetical protein
MYKRVTRRIVDALRQIGMLVPYDDFQAATDRGRMLMRISEGVSELCLEHGAPNVLVAEDSRNRHQRR